MARSFYTTANLLSDVRGLLDESNTDSVSDTTDILPALNRAQEYAFDILARKYPDPILKHVVMTFVAGQNEYDIPVDAFEDRILKLETTIPSATQATQIQIRRISYRDITEYEATTQVAVPSYYSVVGRKIRIIPTPNGTYNARMWYAFEPQRLVNVGGRISTINSVSNYFNVDSVGSDLSSDSSAEGSFVNIINGMTGEIRGTMQIQSINGTQIKLRTSPTRATVLNQTILSAIPATTALDDYLCIVTGTCVPYFSAPIGNFLVQFAVAEITRKLGGQAMQEQQILQKFELQVERSWVARESMMRVKKNNPIWGTAASSRRIYPQSGK